MITHCGRHALRAHGASVYYRTAGLEPWQHTLRNPMVQRTVRRAGAHMVLARLPECCQA
jgi:hypothetical protein